MTTMKEPLPGEMAPERARGADGVSRRVFYFDGKPVEDVTTHPAFTTTAHSVARMYDALHDPARQDVLTNVTERATRFAGR